MTRENLQNKMKLNFYRDIQIVTSFAEQFWTWISVDTFCAIVLDGIRYWLKLLNPPVQLNNPNAAIILVRKTYVIHINLLTFAMNCISKKSAKFMHDERFDKHLHANHFQFLYIYGGSKTFKIAFNSIRP